MRKAWYLGCLPGVLEVDPQVGALGLGALGGVVRLDGVPTHAAAFCNTINSFLICYVWNLVIQFTLFRLLFLESPFSITASVLIALALIAALMFLLFLLPG